jgi:TfoX/Sxy family transcriptional regulator of competence genes
MADPENQTEARFAAIVEALARKPCVTHSKSRGRLFGASALKVHDKIFAMVSSGGQFVVKLPKARVDALVATGVGEHFDAKRGRPMKEWLEVRSESAEEWLELAREALEFVGT